MKRYKSQLKEDYLSHASSVNIAGAVTTILDNNNNVMAINYIVDGILSGVEMSVFLNSDFEGKHPDLSKDKYLRFKNVLIDQLKRRLK